MSSPALSSRSLSPSRRSFLRIAGAAASLPVLTEGHFALAAMQQASGARPNRADRPIPDANAVMINANENPLGPCPAALDAITAVAKTGGRYDATGCQKELSQLLSKEYGIPTDHFLVYAGSSEPLQFASLAFSSPAQPFVSANPSYEAGPRAATEGGAKVLFVPLTGTYAHDLKAMVAASPSAGVLYICNPNNPTGTLTPKEEILWALEHKPKGSILLVDEAYIHLAGDPAELSVMDQVAAGKDLIVLRTFSKIYGMAGIRCGVAAGRPDLLAKMALYGMNPMPVTGVAAACASLKQADLIPTRRKIIADTRQATFAWLTQKGYKFIPSHSNCFMIDTGRPGREVIAALQKEDVYIGRTWPVWPNHVRVSVGTPAEMARFQAAFEKVMTA
jgi:histidinol-phosphate aminotransferase